MRRRIFLWMGLCVLFTTLLLCGNVLAKDTYSVQIGDTLSGIATKHGVTLNALKAANHLTGNRIRAHQTLTIPLKRNVMTIKSKSSSPLREEFYTIKKGDTLTEITRKTGVSVSELRELNQIRGSFLKIGQELALKKTDPEDTAFASPAECTEQAVNSECEEEEGEEGVLTREKALSEIEKQKKDSAALLGKWSNPDEPKLLVKVAMGFLGAPYRLGGTSVTGIDCSGFVKKIYQFFNIDLPRTAFEQSRIGMRVARHELVEGDLLFFNTRKTFGHVGIYIGNNEFVHACSRKKGVRVDNLDTPYYNRHFSRAVRLKGNDGSL
jgi:peptidoglycan DL-endopeptidase LytE